MSRGRGSSRGRGNPLPSSRGRDSSRGRGSRGRSRGVTPPPLVTP